ncbi:MAG: hypothetical protein KME52_28375 [Desmonostoc geniculatum HA4340-LM1]|nr:hypothetical protein [Desmonostoc geniculatum HA4340-LM1]
MANCPSQYQAIESELNLPVELVYWDGQIISPKPTKPEARAIWDNEQLEWIVPPPRQMPSTPDWGKLIALLDSSPEWGRAYAASEKTLKANTAFTAMLTTLTNFRKTETLEFALAKLREAMTGISGVGDFTAEEIVSINQKLTDCGFELQLS